MATSADNPTWWLRLPKHVSLRFLFGVVAFIAVFLGVWQTYFYVPPTHKLPAYEQADSTRRLTARIGPNDVWIASVSRNRFDGSVETETGKGTPLIRDVPGESELASCSRWLDVAQVEIQPGPGQIEIIEAKVFDHATRTLLSQLDPAFGWQVVSPNLLQVYGAGKEVPELLDVWLRIHSYDRDDEVALLSAEAGAKVTLPAGTITLNSVPIRFAHSRGPTPIDLFERVSTSSISLVLERTNDLPELYYQIAAISADKQKQFHDRYIDLAKTGNGEPLTFDFKLSDIDHFELRPYGGRHRFFFEALRLPQSDNRSFSPPPTVRLQMRRGGIQAVLSEYAPLRVRVACKEGLPAEVIVLGRSNVHPQLQLTERGNNYTFTHAVQGVCNWSFSVRFLDATGSYVAQVPLNSQRFRVNPMPEAPAVEGYLLPASGVDALEVTIRAASR